jgi:glycosyltransferase involved in cell wall biosynthesis
VIVGAADHDDAYAAGLAAKASDRVIFTGRLQRHDIGVLYENASLFVLPSYHEGLPIAALEAIGAGAPVLLSDITPNRDLDLHAENYFPLGNIAAIRSKIADPSAIPRVDRRKFLERYDWNLIATSTAEVFRNVCAPLDRRVTQ